MIDAHFHSWQLARGDYRWLTVQHPEQPSFQLGLFRPGPPVHPGR